MRVTDNNKILGEAYRLWEEAPDDLGVDEIKRNIVEEIQAKAQPHLLSRVFLALKRAFHPFSSSRLDVIVDKALDTYKYDLITSGKVSSKLHLLSSEERWFQDHSLIALFKDHLIRAKKQSPSTSRAAILRTQVKRFYGRQELLITRALLHRIAEVFPSFKKTIHFILATARTDYVERQGKKAVKHLDDEAILEGIKAYLSKPSSQRKTAFRTAIEMGAFITFLKAKMQMNRFFSYLRSSVSYYTGLSSGLTC